MDSRFLNENLQRDPIASSAFKSPGSGPVGQRINSSLDDEPYITSSGDEDICGTEEDVDNYNRRNIGNHKEHGAYRNRHE